MLQEANGKGIQTSVGFNRAKHVEIIFLLAILVQSVARTISKLHCPNLCYRMSRFMSRFKSTFSQRKKIESSVLQHSSSQENNLACCI
ncbi:hypothetical protein M758_2G114900 [Ceratodon purpureus]|nr:hypothetical protein M758_2G114900 [Ceratodon purpureus]